MTFLSQKCSQHIIGLLLVSSYSLFHYEMILKG